MYAETGRLNHCTPKLVIHATVIIQMKAIEENLYVVIFVSRYFANSFFFFFTDLNLEWNELLY